MGDDGARALSEALKINTTLTTLDLESVYQHKKSQNKITLTTATTKQATGLVRKEQEH